MQSGPSVLVHLLVILLSWGALAAGWIVFLVAAWRGMRAHESIAESLRRLADKQP